MVTFLLSSGMKTVFFWRLTWLRFLPVGLNFVARVRLEYPPPTRDRLPVIAHSLAIVGLSYDTSSGNATKLIDEPFKRGMVAAVP